MKAFVESEEFRSLNCGFALDEGTAYLNYKSTLIHSDWGCLPFVIHESYGHL